MGDEKYISHLSTLTEIILDEERLVTYVSISKEFCIHVNESKSLLNKAVEEIKKKQPDLSLNVTYIISGLKADNEACTLVCSADDIDDCRKGLNIVFYQHIYSVNKGAPSVDKVAFMSVTAFADYQLCSGLLKNNLCSKRTTDEIGKLKSSPLMSVPNQKITKPPPKTPKEEKVKVTNTISLESAKRAEVKPEHSVKQEKVSPQKNTVNGNKQKPEGKNMSKPQKGIAGFFGRSDGASAKKNIKETKKIEPCKTQSEIGTKEDYVVEMDVDEDVVAKKQMKPEPEDIDEKTVVCNNIKKKENGIVNNKSKNKSLTQIKKNAKVDKKRKRVLHISDSESEEEKDPFVDEEEDQLNKQITVDSEDEIPPTPAVSTIKVASNMLNPRKRRKIVNKTYESEDGYILTRKEEVYESLSENEDTEMKENINKEKKTNDETATEKTESIKMEVSPNVKKTAPKINKKKISPPQKGKQATLMSFFKKA